VIGDANHVATALVVRTPPFEHGVIRHLPATLSELHDLLLEAGVDFLQALRDRFSEWVDRAELTDHRLVVICILPKIRTVGGPVESRELRAFLTDSNIRGIGRDIGIWDWQANGRLGRLLRPDDTRKGQNTDILPLDVVFELDRERAAGLNGLSGVDTTAVTAIGAGALGSQVIFNLVRAGYGTWTVIDKDRLLPHNVARHGLNGPFVGTSKAIGVALWANSTITGPDIVTPIVADVLRPDARETEVRDALQVAEVLLDLSTSVPVARYLAHEPSTRARRVSMFLNPSGRDLVLLAEDQARSVRLDQVEIQYYQWLLDEDTLADHLATADRVRYGITCRSITSTLSQDLIALHAAIGSRAIKLILTEPSATMSIWRLDEATLATRVFRREPCPMLLYSFGDWTLLVTPSVHEQVGGLRRAALPSETGGTLIGAYDLSRRIVYVTGVLQSPPDSLGYPNLYIRGSAGLQDEYRQIGQRTAGMLEYVGEWHSHPTGHDCRPSVKDRTFFKWLERHLSADGLPPLMLIAEGDGRFCWCLNNL